MSLEKLKKISDICILIKNVEKTIEFYTKKLNLKIRRRAEGFVDFYGDTITLAAWELDHINSHTGVSNKRSAKLAHKACIAVELESPETVDQIYTELTQRGVVFYGEPESYVWNARCAYFTDPDGTLWELYAWEEGGPGDYHEVNAEESSHH